jgi:hypothetical protein
MVDKRLRKDMRNGKIKRKKNGKAKKPNMIAKVKKTGKVGGKNKGRKN